MTGAIKVNGEKAVKLASIDPKQDGGVEKDAAEGIREKLGKELSDLQELLYAAGDTSLLIILQGMDTAGKDGAIRGALSYLNPLGVRVASFKVPTAEEAAHDFLWRIHRETPGVGEVTIFNRSHYEDVLVVRVHNLVPKKVWQSRYDDISQFEKILTDSRTIVVKFFLHISKEEQEERLRAREADPIKAWKLAVGDWKERAFWDDYQAAYEDALNKCATRDVPWYVVPADRKWFRDIAILETLVKTLRPYRKEWEARLAKVGATERAALDAYRKENHTK